MSAGNWYFCYGDTVSAEIAGPYETRDLAIEAAKEQFVEDTDNGEVDDDAEMVILRVDAKLKMTKSVQVNIESVSPN